MGLKQGQIQGQDGQYRVSTQGQDGQYRVSTQDQELRLQDPVPYPGTTPPGTCTSAPPMCRPRRCPGRHVGGAGVRPWTLPGSTQDPVYGPYQVVLRTLYIGYLLGTWYRTLYIGYLLGTGSWTLLYKLLGTGSWTLLYSLLDLVYRVIWPPGPGI